MFAVFDVFEMACQTQKTAERRGFLGSGRKCLNFPDFLHTQWRCKKIQTLTRKVPKTRINTGVFVFDTGCQTWSNITNMANRRKPWLTH